MTRLAGRLFAIYPSRAKAVGMSAGLLLFAWLIWTRVSLFSILRGAAETVGRFLALPYSWEPIHEALTTAWGAAGLAVIVGALTALGWWLRRIRFRWPVPARNWLWLFYGLPLLLVLLGGLAGGFILWVITPLTQRYGRR